MPLFGLTNAIEEERILTEQDRRRAQMQSLRAQVTPEMAQNLIDTARMYPNLPNGVLQGLAVAGVPSGHPSVAGISAAVADRERSGFADFFGDVVGALTGGVSKTLGEGYDILRGATRLAFLTFEGAIDEAVLRPFRMFLGMASGQVLDPETGQVTRRNLSLGEAYRLAGASSLSRAAGQFLSDPIGAFTGDNHINLGSGFFPISEPEAELAFDESTGTFGLSPDADPKASAEYQRLIINHTPAEAIDIINTNRGLPITQRRDEMAARLRLGVTEDNPLGISLSPGKWLASSIWEPGTIPFNLVSGVLDAGVQLGFDPAAFALGAASRGGRAARAIYAPGATPSGLGIALGKGVEGARPGYVARGVRRLIERTGHEDLLYTTGRAERQVAEADRRLAQLRQELDTVTGQLSRRTTLERPLETTGTYGMPRPDDYPLPPAPRPVPAERYTLPPRYAEDAISREIIPESTVMKETRRAIEVELTPEQYRELLGDAEFYGFPPPNYFLPGYEGLSRSARTAVKRLKEQPWRDMSPPPTPRGATPSGPSVVMPTATAAETDLVARHRAILDEMRDLQLPSAPTAHRKTFIADDIDTYLNSRAGIKTLEQFVDNNGPEGFVRNYDLLARSTILGRPDADVVRRLTENSVRPGRSRDMAINRARSILRDLYWDGHLPQKINPTSFLSKALTGSDGRSVSAALGGLIYGDAGRVGGFQYAIRNRFGQDKLGRFFSRMPTRIGVRIDDIHEGVRDLNDWMFSAGLSAEVRGRFLLEMSKMRPGDAFAFQGLIKRVGKELVDKIVADRAEDLAKTLSGTDLATALAHEEEVVRRVLSTATRTIEDLEGARKYGMDALGNNIYNPLQDIRFIGVGADGTITANVPSAGILTEFQSRYASLPDPRRVRQVMSKFRNLTTKVDAKDIMDDRAWVKAIDGWMTKFWKPSVLLRVAWPMRVIGEEQVRMAGAGLDSMFRHPLSWIAWMTSKRSDTLANGSFIEDALEWKASLSRAGGGILGRLPSASGRAGRQKIIGTNRRALLHNEAWGLVHRGQRRHVEGVWNTLEGLVNDDFVREIARLTPDGSARASAEAKAWLRTGAGRRYLDRLSTESSADHARMLMDPQHRGELADALADMAWARANAAAGAHITQHLGDTPLAAGRAPVGRFGVQEVVLDGPIPDPEILQFIRSGQTADGWSYFDHIRDHPNDLTGARKRMIEYLEKIEADDTAAGLGTFRLPKAGKVEIGGMLGEKSTAWDDFVDMAFTVLMSRPTNRLSRSPAFKQFYWQTVERLMPALDDATRQAVLANADAADLSSEVLRRLRTSPRTTAWRARETGGVAMTADDVDHLAKASALDQTQTLLYDLSKRSHATDVLRNFTPFAEAWWEIMTSWSRIASKNPDVLRRFQQVYTGAREADPFNKDRGFFYVDPQTGQEVFAYPAIGGLVAGAPKFGWEPRGTGNQVGGGTIPGVGSNALPGMEFAAPTSGLNLFTGAVIPGLGPVVQMPMSLLLDKTGVLDDKNFRYIRDLVLPFGPIDVDDIASIEALTPGVVRILQGFGIGNDAESRRLQANTTIEIYRSILLSGQYDVTNADPQVARREMDRALAKAKSSNRFLTIVRGFAQTILPSSPLPQFNVRIADEAGVETAGQVFTFSTLAQEWHDRLNKPRSEGGFGGDSLATTDWFIHRYGLTPEEIVTFAQPKTISVTRRGITENAFYWESDNSDLFNINQYPLTASFGAPADDGPFYYPAYMRQIAEGSRVGLTLDQWAQKRNDLLGNLQYETLRRSPEMRALIEANYSYASILLRAHRLYLKEAYPGYGRAIPGVPETPRVTDMIDEFTRWSAEPRLADSNVGRGVAQYLQRREIALGYAQSMGLVSFGTAQKAAWIREWLRQEAAKIIQQNPDFLLAWQFAFKRELIDELEASASPMIGFDREPSLTDLENLGLLPAGATDLTEGF